MKLFRVALVIDELEKFTQKMKDKTRLKIDIEDERHSK
jgi:hypothetical protein